MSRPAFLRALALVSPLVACGGGGAPVPVTPAPVASPSPTTVATSTPEGPPADPTAGSGPCRCSWDTNQAGAPRVCKKSEMSYKGVPCVPGAHVPDDDYPVGGPLPPPEFV